MRGCSYIRSRVLETLYLGFVTEYDYFFTVTEHGNAFSGFDAMPW